MSDTEIIYFVSVATLAAVLIRGARTRSAKTYSYFYTQLGVSFVLGLAAYGVHSLDLKAYDEFYWIAQFLTMTLACANIPEILRHAFVRHSDTRRFAAALNLLLIVVVMAFVSVILIDHGNWHDTARFIRLERDFRAVEALILVALLAGVFYFGVPLGGNLTGLFAGYGLYIGASLITVAVDSRFPRLFAWAWSRIEALSYLASLLIYIFAFWDFHPPPIPENTDDINQQAEEMLESIPEHFRLLQ